MKGKIVIECIPEEQVSEVVKAEGWTGQGVPAGISVNVGLSATRVECVEICYSLCRSLNLDPMEKALLFMKLMGEMPGDQRKVFSIKGPMHGMRNETGGDPPPLL